MWSELRTTNFSYLKGYIGMYSRIARGYANVIQDPKQFWTRIVRKPKDLAPSEIMKTYYVTYHKGITTPITILLSECKTGSNLKK